MRLILNTCSSHFVMKHKKTPPQRHRCDEMPFAFLSTLRVVGSKPVPSQQLQALSTKATIFGGPLLRNPGPGRALEPRRSPGRAPRCPLTVPGRPFPPRPPGKQTQHIHRAPGGGARRHPPFWGRAEAPTPQAAAGPEPSQLSLASSRRGRAVLPAGLGDRTGPCGCHLGPAGRSERRSRGGPCDKAQCAASW